LTRERIEEAECANSKTHSAFDLHDMKMDGGVIAADAKLLEAHGLERL